MRTPTQDHPGLFKHSSLDVDKEGPDCGVNEFLNAS